MTAELFHSIFDQLVDPVLLKSGEGWLCNPAAQSLSLSEGDLLQLEDCDEGAFLWLSLRFYHVSLQRLDGAPLLMLHADTFLADVAENVSSQLRQRLQSAFGCTSDLSRVGGVRNDLRARERLCGLNRELYQLLRMTQELEMGGRLEPVACQFDCFNLVAVLVRLGDELRELFRPAEVELKLELEPSELIVAADLEKLKYLILSLVSNSLPHLPSSGGRITLGLREQSGQAVITVLDNGSGFSPDLLAHPLWSQPQRLIFGRGLGLGLPLVQRIAAAHQGTVMVFPSAKGSRVTVSIPVHTPTDVLAEPAAPCREQGGFSMAKVVLSNALPRSVYFPSPDGDDD